MDDQEALRAGRPSFTPPTLPVGGRRGVPRREYPAVLVRAYAAGAP